MAIRISCLAVIPLCIGLLGAGLATSGHALDFPLPAEGEDVVGEVQIARTHYKDTFADLVERYDLGYSELVAANPGVDPWLPGEGTEIVLPTRFILPPGPRQGIVINLAEYRLYYFSPEERRVYTFPLGIGREGWSSPTTTTRIVAGIANPAWYPPASIRAEHASNGDPLPAVVPPGPDNPLGPFKFRLALPGYLIHGSNKAFGVGTRVSHGCFRMLNADVLHLSRLAGAGTRVRIINEPYKSGYAAGYLLIETHAPLDKNVGSQAGWQQKLLRQMGREDIERLGPFAGQGSVQLLSETGQGIPVSVARQLDR